MEKTDGVQRGGTWTQIPAKLELIFGLWLVNVAIIIREWYSPGGILWTATTGITATATQNLNGEREKNYIKEGRHMLKVPRLVAFIWGKAGV